MADDSDQDSSEACRTLAEKGGRRVRILPSLLDEYETLPVKMQARFKRIMEMWCEGHRMPKEMLNMSEGRSSHKNRMIQAFKAFKVRLYGFVTGSDFLVVEIDPAKKRDKADPRILDRAKIRADSI